MDYNASYVNLEYTESADGNVSLDVNSFIQEIRQKKTSVVELAKEQIDRFNRSKPSFSQQLQHNRNKRDVPANKEGLVLETSKLDQGNVGIKNKISLAKYSFEGFSIEKKLLCFGLLLFLLVAVAAFPCQFFGKLCPCNQHCRAAWAFKMFGPGPAGVTHHLF